MRPMLVTFIVGTVIPITRAPLLALDDDCPHHEATIEALDECVEHAANVGHINNLGVAHSLLAKLNAAQAALDRGNPSAALKMLQGFVQEVEGQAGVHIGTEPANHLLDHAALVVQALDG